MSLSWSFFQECLESALSRWLYDLIQLGSRWLRQTTNLISPAI